MFHITAQSKKKKRRVRKTKGFSSPDSTNSDSNVESVCSVDRFKKRRRIRETGEFNQLIRTSLEFNMRPTTSASFENKTKRKSTIENNCLSNALVDVKENLMPNKEEKPQKNRENRSVDARKSSSNATSLETNAQTHDKKDIGVKRKSLVHNIDAKSSSESEDVVFNTVNTRRKRKRAKKNYVITEASRNLSLSSSQLEVNSFTSNILQQQNTSHESIKGTTFELVEVNNIHQPISSKSIRSNIRNSISQPDINSQSDIEVLQEQVCTSKTIKNNLEERNTSHVSNQNSTFEIADTNIRQPRSSKVVRFVSPKKKRNTFELENPNTSIDALLSLNGNDGTPKQLRQSTPFVKRSVRNTPRQSEGKPKLMYSSDNLDDNFTGSDNPNNTSIEKERERSSSSNKYLVDHSEKRKSSVSRSMTTPAKIVNKSLVNSSRNTPSSKTIQKTPAIATPFNKKMTNKNRASMTPNKFGTSNNKIINILHSNSSSAVKDISSLKQVQKTISSSKSIIYSPMVTRSLNKKHNARSIITVSPGHSERRIHRSNSAVNIQASGEEVILSPIQRNETALNKKRNDRSIITVSPGYSERRIRRSNSAVNNQASGDEIILSPIQRNETAYQTTSSVDSVNCELSIIEISSPLVKFSIANDKSINCFLNITDDSPNTLTSIEKGLIGMQASGSQIQTSKDMNVVGEPLICKSPSETHSIHKTKNIQDSDEETIPYHIQRNETADQTSSSVDSINCDLSVIEISSPLVKFSIASEKSINCFLNITDDICNKTTSVEKPKGLIEVQASGSQIQISEDMNVVGKPLVCKSPLETLDATHKTKPSTSKPSTSKKMPNFARIHQQAFNKMEDIQQMTARKAARAQQLLSGKKPESQRHLISPKCRKPLLYSPKGGISISKANKKIPVLQNYVKTMVKVMQPSTSNPKVAHVSKPVLRKIEQSKMKSNLPRPVSNQGQEKKILSKLGFKADTPQKKTKIMEEEIKAAASRSRVLKSTVDTRRNAVQNIRTNRRFELLMQMRAKK